MADDPKKKDKSSAKPKQATAPGSGGGGNPGMDPGAGGPPMAMPTAGGSALGGNPAMGASPPMPGSGIDPYAALMGQVSSAPMSMPMGTGPDGMNMAPGGMGSGMGMGVQAPGMETQGPTMTGGPPQDDITRALMSDANPAKYGADLAESALGPAGQQDMMGASQMPGGMSLDQILQLLTMMQGGMPGSGLPPAGAPGSVAVGMGPNELQMG